MGSCRDRDINLVRLRSLMLLCDSELLQSDAEGARPEPSRCRARGGDAMTEHLIEVMFFGLQGAYRDHD